MSEIRLIDANALRERLLVLRSNIANVQCISDIFDICLTEVSNAPTVDFEKLGESLRCQIRAEYGSCDDCELSCPRNELIKLLDSARSQGEWIPISERLPEEWGRYLVTEKVFAIDDRNHRGKFKVETEQVEFYDGKWKRAKFFEVIAWQPLPEPYKEGSAE